MARVFVTGVGAMTPIGLGRAAYWEALLAGRSGAGPITQFDTSRLDRGVGCEILDFRARDHLTAAEARHTGRCAALTLASAREAVEQSGLGGGDLASERASVVMGTTMGEASILGEMEAAWFRGGDSAINVTQIPRYGTTLLPIHVARVFGTRGMVQTLPAACAAGNYAIGFAADQIRAGRADVVLTGAAEIMEMVQFAGFARLGALAPERCQPFDKHRRGLLLGEGAGVLVLESERSVVKRDATPLAEVGGSGLACDAHHITRPHPDGKGSAHAMREAIRTSGLTPSDVDFINAHGTGTHANDPIESKVIQEVFDDREVPVSSIKSMLGHCMGAASAVEAVSCVQTVQHDLLPPTVHMDEQDPECPVNLVVDVPRRARANVVLNNALAFGGYDAVLAIAKPGVLPHISPGDVG